MATRLSVLDPALAEGKAKDLLDSVRKSMGMTSNMTKIMAQAPAVLEAYLAFNGALSKGVLDPKLRSRVALAVSELNHCGYCVSAHTALGKKEGLTDDQILAARAGRGTDAQTAAVLRLVRSIVEHRGDVHDEDLVAIRATGLGDREIAEIVGHVALSIFTNYFNRLAGTEIDFPKVEIGVLGKAA